SDHGDRHQQAADRHRHPARGHARARPLARRDGERVRDAALARFPPRRAAAAGALYRSLSPLRIVAGVEDRAGRRTPGPAERRRLLPWRSVEQNVRLAAPDVTDAKLAELFRILELEAHRSHFPGELSLGLARRVALARAFAVEPDLLVLDEPLASLDDALAGRLRDEIAMLVDDRSVMTLLVTHDVDDAVRLADRLFLLSP